MDQVRVVTWDWKEQPSFEDISDAVYELSNGTVLMREFDTGGDCYAWVISNREVSDEEAERVWANG